MSKVDVLLGLQWGDEGKGKAVDILTPKYDIVARFQGGPNAGHTLEFNGIKHVLHQIPSGIFHPNKLNIVGSGVVIDPVVFMKEIDDLSPFDLDVYNSLVLSDKAQLILPTHKKMDKAIEASKGKDKIGSTLRGIGPTYGDKIARNGLRMGDIVKKDFEKKYKALLSLHTKALEAMGAPTDVGAEEELFFNKIEELRKFKITSTEYLINESLIEGKTILAEGAQGTLLDLDFGTYPFVTSSNTTSAGACTGLGIAPNKLNKVFGVFKAYCTRVGSGPFPTELQGEEGETLRKKGNEFGATTGRSRRCGWLDLPALNFSCMINGVTELFMMKSDVLSEIAPLKVCTKYAVAGQETTKFPISTLDKSEPIFQEVPSWSIKGKELPHNLLQFVKMIENDTNTKIQMVSLGPDRVDTHFL